MSTRVAFYARSSNDAHDVSCNSQLREFDQIPRDKLGSLFRCVIKEILITVSPEDKRRFRLEIKWLPETRGILLVEAGGIEPPSDSTITTGLHA